MISEALNRAQSAAPDRVFGPLQPAGLPSEIFTKGGKMTFGKEEIEYYHVPLAHTDGDAFVFLPGANVLHTGDLLFNGIYPYIDYCTGGWIGGMVSACDALLKVVNAGTRIIPGHGPVASRDDLQATRDMLATVHERLEPMSQQGKSLKEVIALQPTKDLDEKWGNGLTSAQFLEMAYPSIAAHNKRE